MRLLVATRQQAVVNKSDYFASYAKGKIEPQLELELIQAAQCLLAEAETELERRRFSVVVAGGGCGRKSRSSSSRRRLMRGTEEDSAD